MTTFDREGQVCPDCPMPPGPRRWLLIISVLSLGLGITAVIDSMRQPAPVVIVTPDPYTLRGPPATPLAYPTYPRELVRLAAIQLTRAAPTIPPTLQPAPSPSVVTVSVCQFDTTKGAVCTMPTNTPLPPTPLPACPVYPGSDCVATGTWAPAMESPTPTPS